MSLAIRIENISKQYRLGEIGTGTLSHDLQRCLARLRGKPDPFGKVGELNDPAKPTFKKARQNSNALDSDRYQADGDDLKYVWALRDISMDVMRGEVLGIVGRNGAGKSTLLKILSRVTGPTAGRIQVSGRIASLLEVGTGFHPELTGRENIFLNGAILGMGRREVSRRMEDIVEFSGCAKYIDTPVKRYSSGMTVRLGFAVAAHLECDILVVDEVLAVGDAQFQQRCLGKMQSVSNAGRCVLFVSHNMGAVSQLCNRCALLERGQLVYHGNVSEAIRQYLNAGSSGTVIFSKQERTDFQFVNATISDRNGIPCGSFNFTDPVILRVSYQLQHRMDGLEIGVRVNSSEGPIVFSTLRSHYISQEVRMGSNIIEVTIPGEFLNPGDYSIDLGAHIPNQRMLDHRENAIGFRILETGSPFSQYAGTRFGLVHCKCMWRDV